MRRKGARRTSVNMQDWELYRRILGIEAPWQVERVELKLETGEVHIYLDHAADVTWSCPECSAPKYATTLLADEEGYGQREHSVVLATLPGPAAATGPISEQRSTALWAGLCIHARNYTYGSAHPSPSGDRQTEAQLIGFD